MPHVIQFSRTPVAHVPECLADAITTYADGWDSSVCHDPSKLPTKWRPDTVVLFHNTWVKTELPSILLYHSEPDHPCLWNYTDKKYANDPTRPKKIYVIPQYQSLLEPFTSLPHIRNVIDIYDERYMPKEVRKLRVSFSPSTKGPIVRGWYGKGHDETKAILERVAARYPHFSYDIIHGVSLNECLERRRNCSIHIDEVVTPCYHRSGLEGLSQGKLTICSLSPEVEQVLCNASGAPCSPYQNVWLDNLEEYLCELATEWTMERILEEGRQARHWMEMYWKPETIVAEIINELEKVF